jgi:TonB family protein
VRPKYPEAALAAGVQGVVILEVTIGPDGAVQETRILRSIPLLDDAAVSAVREWQFAPTLLNGAPIPIIMTVTVNFTLDLLTPHACAEEPSLKSATPVTPRSIRFFNASGAPRKVYWLTSGERRLRDHRSAVVTCRRRCRASLGGD